MRRCFIHVGTHKTGTASLQQTLSAHRDRLETLGFLYPLTGRPPTAPHGHHNIAWEISGDYRFRKRYGTIEDLLTTVDAAHRDVILSSEDFVSSAHYCARFSSFIDRLNSHVLDVTFIVYFRNQIDFAKSLYLTLLLFGFDVPFSKYVEEILAHGQFRWRDWVFPFDYENFLGRLQSIDGAEIVVRSYDAVAPGSFIGDFLSILGLGPDDFAADESIRLNERIPDAAAVECFYRNCVWRWPRASVRAALAALLPSDRIQLDMSDASKQRFIEKFEVSNNRVLSAHGLPAFEHMRAEQMQSAPGNKVWMEDVFAPELRGAVRERMKSPNAPVFKVR